MKIMSRITFLPAVVHVNSSILVAVSHLGETKKLLYLNSKKFECVFQEVELQMKIRDVFKKKKTFEWKHFYVCIMCKIMMTKPTSLETKV